MTLTSSTEKLCTCNTGLCGNHQLVLTQHAEGWMAGCHCRETFGSPKGLYEDEAVAEAEILFMEHKRRVTALLHRRGWR